MSARPATPTAPRRGPGWYRGDLHVHSVASDGELTPRQLVADARGAGLDFIAVTEHNMVGDRTPWLACAGRDLIMIFGEEVTTEDGHWLALGLPPGELIEWLYRAEDGEIGARAQRVRRAGGLSVVAHPHAPYQSGAFRFPYECFDAVEVWNGLWSSERPWNADNETALAEWAASIGSRGGATRRRTAVGNSDAHLKDQIGLPQTIVWAADRTPDAILAGVRRGRCWIASSARVTIRLAAAAGARRAGIGEFLQLGHDELAVRLRVEGVASGSVALHTDRGVVCTATLEANGAGDVRWRSETERPTFVRAEVRYPGGQMAAITNPVFFAAGCES